MGNDGGDIPGRKELVRQRPAPLLTPEEVARSLAQHCFLTKEPLQSLLAVDSQGRLYNYVAVLAALAHRSSSAVRARLDKFCPKKLADYQELACRKEMPLACVFT
jgi:hypothetical protein